MMEVQRVLWHTHGDSTISTSSKILLDWLNVLTINYC